MLNTVKVPDQFVPLFQKAQEVVERFFKDKIEDPTKGTIDIFGQRYILIRAGSLSVDFFDTIREIFKSQGKDEAINMARQLLYAIANSIGKQDARNFHTKMNLVDPIEKLSAGPIHFAYSGWAFVNIFPESKPTPDENYYLIYDHPFSFESDTWLKKGTKTDFPVCVMNTGYSSGWCEESFGIPLTAVEILCKAKGDDCCRFIMSPPGKIDAYVQEYKRKEPQLAAQVINYSIPDFFEKKRKQDEERTTQITELKEMNDAMIGRELRMAQLKKELETIRKNSH
jgi:two-component system, cell cycle sensor histidine kinase and response regulator CckA